MNTKQEIENSKYNEFLINMFVACEEHKVVYDRTTWADMVEEMVVCRLCDMPALYVEYWNRYILPY